MKRWVADVREPDRAARFSDVSLKAMSTPPASEAMSTDDDDDVYYYICWRLKLEGETENMGVCTKERKGVAAEVLMATPCTNSLECESEGHKHM